MDTCTGSQRITIGPEPLALDGQRRFRLEPGSGPQLRSSATARLIARCTLLAAREPALRALVPVGAEAPLAAQLAADDGARWFGVALRQAWSRAALQTLERAVLPGISVHYLARKRWLESAVREALLCGTRQVVVLGAGLDTLAWRLHREFTGARFFELDHPGSQAPKRSALGPGDNLTYLPCDLASESPAAILRACRGFSVDSPTLFLAEGLLMYFPEKRVTTLLREIATLTQPRPAVLFTFMARGDDGTITFRGEHAAIGWWLRRRGEPFRWGLAPAALAQFLAPLGLQVLSVADHTTLRTAVLSPLGLAGLPLARGECICQCAGLAP